MDFPFVPDQSFITQEALRILLREASDDQWIELLERLIQNLSVPKGCAPRQTGLQDQQRQKSKHLVVLNDRHPPLRVVVVH